MMRKFQALALSLALAAPAGAADTIDSQAGTSGAQFLKLGAGARAGAMADSFSAIADDPTAAYYNPAGLFQMTEAGILGAHTAYFQGTNYEVLNLAYPWSRQKDFSRHTLGLGIYYFSIDSIEQRTSDSTDPVGTFNANDGAYALSYAYGVNRRLGLGATAKLISQNLFTYHANAFAMDFGGLYRLNPDGARPATVSAVLKNLGTRPRFAGENSDPLPVSGTVGLGYQAIPKRLRFNVEGTLFRDETGFGSFGGEYYHPLGANITGAFRMGYSSQHKSLAGLNGLTMGAGLTLRKMTFDFAWLPFGHLGNTFRYSLLIKF